ncbi:MAG TPA: hypothetical protein DD979_17720 [Gammaproteobacteria bacterium]|jgi:thiol-disulfide isomerase/thioredoxin|nr:hypothetical protein [Gammaproteobacteria bacterium]
MVLYGYWRRRVLSCLLLFALWVTPLQASDGVETFNDIPLTDLSGQTIQAKTLITGKPTYLKFWASWCQPCLKQMPHFQSVQETFNDTLTVIAVNIDLNDSPADIARVKEKYGLTMPILMDTTGRLAQRLNFIGTPYHVLMDTTGQVRYQSHEADQALDDKLQQLAKQSIAGDALALYSESHDAPSDITDSTPTALWFTSTWCDWYPETSRPAMSQNCFQSNTHISKLMADFPQLQWQGVISRLWTGEKELEEFREKYQLTLPLSLDDNDKMQVRHHVKNHPTLIIFNAGKELMRIDAFGDYSQLKAQLAELQL